MEKQVADKMRDAGKVQADPALAAIQELSDSVAASFEVLEAEDKNTRIEAQKLLAEVKSDVEKTRTEVAAGFKVHAQKIDTLDRRSVALGYGGSKDIDGVCLAALGEKERKDIFKIGCMQAGAKIDRERYPLRASAVGATLIAHLLRASTLIQKRRFSSQEEERELYAAKDRYEKAINEAFGVQTAAAFLTTTDTLGGHWLPEPVANELYRLILDNSIIGSQCSHVPMTTKTLDLPVEGSSALSVSWGSENTTITDSVPAANALNKVTLTANRIQGFAQSSMEELQDSAISILSWVQTKLTEMAGREIDRVILEGAVGAPPLFAGLQTAAGVNAVTTGANGDAVTYQTLVDLVFKARERASRENAKFICAPEIMAKIVGLTDSTGQPVVQFGTVPNRFAASILGFPVEVHSVIKADKTYGTGTTLSCLYFGPLSQIVMGDRMGMAWDVSDIPGFTTATTSMRLIARVGFAIAVPAAFSRHENLKA